MKVTFIYKLHSDAAVMKTAASYSPHFHQCVYFSLCLKTRACVLNFYYFLNRTFGVVTVKGIFSQSLAQEENFPPILSRIQLQRILVTRRELFSAVKKSKQSSVHFTNSKHSYVFEHFLRGDCFLLHFSLGSLNISSYSS